MPLEPDLRDLELYCNTDKQRAYVSAAQAMGVSAAAEHFGVSDRNMRNRLKRLRTLRDAAEAGGEVPGPQYLLPGQRIRGISALTRSESGDPVWIKTEADKETEEELEELRAALMESLPREKAVTKAKRGKNDPKLLNCFILTDFHIGLRCWPEETGDDWNTKLAEDTLVNWFRYAIKSAPSAGTAVLGQLGDFLHWDGIDAITPTSGHILSDTDGRYQKLIRIAIRALRRIIRELLRTHDNVHLVMAEGNHDLAGSMWLREVFHALYDEEPRVTVDRSPDPYYVYEFDKVLLLFHHGHKKRPQNIDDVFVSKFREEFGRTKFAYAHMGHLHHDRVLETNLMRVEQHRTLAGKDSYASRLGLEAGRSACCITYHKEYGEVRRETITPEML
jgi:hypothetical protein